MTTAKLAPQLVPTFTFGEFLGHPVRWNKDPNQALWVLRDLCRAIDLNFQGRATLPTQHQDYVSQERVWTNGGPQNLVCVNEPGLHALVSLSANPLAIKFQKWVLEDILPAIRRAGAYLSNEVPIYSFQSDKGQLIEITARVDKLNQQLSFVQEELEIANQKIKNLEEGYALPALPASQQKEALEFLLALPPAENVPQISERQQLVNIVRASAIASGGSGNEFQRRFNQLYREFKYRCGVDLKARAFNSGKSTLAVAEQPGKKDGKELPSQIPALINIAVELFGNAPS